MRSSLRSLTALVLFVAVHSFSIGQPYRSATRSATDLSLSSSNVQSSTTTSGSSAVRSFRPSTPIDSELQLQLLSFYRFVPISNPAAIRDALFDQLLLIPGVRGTVYVASEGINAQFSVPVGDQLRSLLQTFGKEGCLPFDAFEQNPPNMGDVVDSNVSTFDRLIVRTRDYILRDGIPLEDGDAPLDWSDSGTELDAEDWHEQLQKSNVQLFDCRNDYESDQGTFQSAQPLNTKTFSETWSVLDDQVKSDAINPDEPVYIFCTGGIRCVKVGSYLKNKLGCKDVRSLRHGIIGYERWASDADQSLWDGENFLFDKRRFSKEEPEQSDEESE
mmetsp:Transcript_33711/g.68535  ORF Transcript_33711/g.68535 Transcript_33711/m.68535 type:complete len:331 (-) Transcript_33711:3462-4454(-)